MPKDVVVPDIAEWYRKRGFTALIFDTFGIGASDGEPRHDVSCIILSSSLGGGQLTDLTTVTERYAKAHRRLH